MIQGNCVGHEPVGVFAAGCLVNADNSLFRLSERSRLA